MKRYKMRKTASCWVSSKSENLKAFQTLWFLILSACVSPRLMGFDSYMSIGFLNYQCFSLHSFLTGSGLLMIFDLEQWCIALLRFVRFNYKSSLSWFSYNKRKHLHMILHITFPKCIATKGIKTNESSTLNNINNCRSHVILILIFVVKNCFCYFFEN